jgi:threonine dehydrogenase-like Zn-dependent dehydrogenase
MMGAVLPGNSTVELRDFPIPEPGHGQVLIKTKSSTICGSDIRAIYREHVGRVRKDTKTKSPGMNPAAKS